jgi:FixJ family two-component response regulator
MKPGNTDYKIVVVDDDDAVRDSLVTVIGTIYPNVVEFSSGREYLSAVEPHGRSCLILDIHMPNMSGLDVMRELAARELQIPTILITGRSDSALRSSAETYGVVALLDKPLDHERLISAIDKCLNLLLP